MSRIVYIRGREIIDSRGNPTVEAIGCWRRAWSAAPPCVGRIHRFARSGGIARWRCERFMGKGVRNAVAHVNKTIRDLAMGLDAQIKSGLDAKMIAADGTETKSNLGANAILAVSLAAAMPRRVTANCPCIGIWAAPER